MGQKQEQEIILVENDIRNPQDLVIFNDDINTFDHVINTLIRVCRHTQEQAEQCTMIIHNKGKCAVKNGSLHQLKPMRDSICEEGIDARII